MFYNLPDPIMHGDFSKKLYGVHEDRLGGISEPAPSMITIIAASLEKKPEKAMHDRMGQAVLACVALQLQCIAAARG